MKKLFLTSVFAKTAKEFKKFYGETNGKSAVLIPTAAKAEQIALGKAYIGESAGAVIVAPSITYIEDMDDRAAAPDLSDCSALGLVDFYPLPHMNSFPFKKASRKIAGKYSNSLPIKATQSI